MFAPLSTVYVPDCVFLRPFHTVAEPDTFNGSFFNKNRDAVNNSQVIVLSCGVRSFSSRHPDLATEWHFGGLIHPRVGSMFVADFAVVRVPT